MGNHQDLGPLAIERSIAVGLEPLLVIDPPPQSKLRTYEIFGPFLTILPFASEEDAVALATTKRRSAAPPALGRSDSAG